MHITPGIFAKTFERPTLEANLDAIVDYGLHAVQFNLSCAGLPTLPDAIEPELVKRVRREMHARNITLSALSGTYNMIDPDLHARQVGLQRLRVLAAACKELDTSIITLCTGTREASDMWRWHPDNASKDAWTDLCRVMEQALQIAEDENVILAFEPEQANVIYSAPLARRLLDTMRSSHLKVVIDAANLFGSENVQERARILDEAFALLGPDIVLAHAKDRQEDGTVTPAGTGVIDYAQYIRLLRSVNFAGPLILHSLDEAQVPAAVRFLTEKLDAV